MKALVQLFGAALAAVLPLLTVADALTLTEWINVGVVAAGAVTVWLAKNELPGDVWHYTKMFMSVVSAGGVVLVSTLADQSMSPVEWLQVSAAVLTALAVRQTPALARAA